MMPCAHTEQAPIHERHYQKNRVYAHKIASYAIVLTKLMMMHVNKHNQLLQLLISWIIPTG